MAEAIIKVERAAVELKIKNLIELLKKQDCPIEKTQHLRGQIAAWEAVEEWGTKVPIKTKRDPDEPAAIPLY